MFYRSPLNVCIVSDGYDGGQQPRAGTGLQSRVQTDLTGPRRDSRQFVKIVHDCSKLVWHGALDSVALYPFDAHARHFDCHGMVHGYGQFVKIDVVPCPWAFDGRGYTGSGYNLNATCDHRAKP